MREEAGTKAALPADAAAALIERGNALVRQGRPAAALEQYSAALALQPGRFEAHANLGTLLLAVQRCAEAEVHLRRALALRPGELPLCIALGRACHAQGKAEEAEAIFLGVLSVAPDHAEALVALGGLSRDRGDFARAEAYYRRALERAPETAAAHYGLGHCLREEGRSAEAADCFEHAIAAQPDFVDAHYRLAVLKPGGADPAHRGQLESLQPRVAAMPMAQQVRYWFALGRWREDAGDCDAAFAAYAEGNRLQSRRLALPERYPAQEALEARFVERIRQTFNGGWLGASAGRPATDARVPVFVVGMPRSGTSLLEQMLAAHPSVHGGGESRDFPCVLEDTFGFAESEQGNAYPEIVPSLPADALERLGNTYLDRMWRQAPHASHMTDKLTGNFLHAGMIHLALPQAKIIHVARDPRDTCFSCFANLFRLGDIPYSYNLETLGRHCVRCSELMRHWHAVLPADAIMTVRYEDLVAATEEVLRRVIGFIGLSWNDECLRFNQKRRAVRTVSAGQVGRPVYKTSMERWRRFEPHLEPLLAILEKGG